MQKIALIIIVLFYIFCILKAVKRKNMRIGYLIFWMIIGIVFIISLLIPNLVENISNILGFEMPINMIVCFAIFVILYLIFDLTILITKEYNKKRVEELEKKDD